MDGTEQVSKAQVCADWARSSCHMIIKQLIWEHFYLRPTCFQEDLSLRLRMNQISGGLEKERNLIKFDKSTTFHID